MKKNRTAFDHFRSCMAKMEYQKKKDVESRKKLREEKKKAS